MPADTLSREATPIFREKVRRMHSDIACGYFVSPSSDFLRELAEHALSEPARLASARAEGVREGIEAAKVAVREARIDVPGPDVSVDYLCGVNRGASQMKDGIKSALGAISPPPAEPAWTPTHRHYKGALYRELMRGRREGSAEPMVAYQAENGDVWFRPVDEFDAEIDPGGGWMRRYEPIPYFAPPAEPTGMTADGWIEWKGGECPVDEDDKALRLDLRFRNGTKVRSARPGGWRWSCVGDGGDIIAYRIVKLAEPSAPVAAEGFEKPSPGAFVAEIEGAGYRNTIMAQAARITALEAENAALKAENAKLRERARLVVAALDGPGANARLLVTAVDGLRALLQGGPDAS